jgi:hypothetical protein
MLAASMSNQQPQPETTPASIEVADVQREVQQLLGRCMLRFQQYEHLLKALVAHHEIAGPADSIGQIREERIQDVATNTLGVLIGKLLESYVVVSESKREVLDVDEPANAIAFGFRTSLEMNAEDYARTRDSLKDLVELRNGLVHHFIERFDLWQVATCAAARDYLLMCYDRIESHYVQLRSWIEHTEQVRQLAASFMQSPAYRDFVVNGIAPDGVVDWRAAGCVSVLLEATGRLAIDGWTPLDAAVQWIDTQHPDQTPEKYHCRSWPQVLFESRRFELCYREEDGSNQPWYRERRRRERV